MGNDKKVLLAMAALLIRTDLARVVRRTLADHDAARHDDLVAHSAAAERDVLHYRERLKELREAQEAREGDAEAREARVAALEAWCARLAREKEELERAAAEAEEQRREEAAAREEGRATLEAALVKARNAKATLEEELARAGDAEVGLEEELAWARRAICCASCTYMPFHLIFSSCDGNTNSG